MRFIWGKKEFTLIIIPGANRRTVRIKLPHSSLYMMPSIVLLVLFGFFFTIYWMDTHFEQTTSSMQQSFDGQERRLSDEITLKETELEQLQTNLIELSEQTNEFKAKLEEIKKLEHVIELMTETDTSGPKTNKTSALRTAPLGKEDELHVGGIETSVAAEDVSQLVLSTKQDLGVLVHDINRMLVDLTESEAKLVEAQHIRNVTPTIWPTSSRLVTSRFGIRLDPFTRKPSMHSGMDIDGELGDPVYATAEGKITAAGWDSAYGNHIRINHSRGLETGYLHLSKLLVKKGDTVTKGQQIGLVGSTGRSTGTHLHYEVHRNRVQVDPTPYLLTHRKDE